MYSGLVKSHVVETVIVLTTASYRVEMLKVLYSLVLMSMILVIPLVLGSVYNIICFAMTRVDV